MVCNTDGLSNIGLQCKITWKKIVGCMFVSKYDTTGVKNKISVTDAQLIAQWQARFNVYNFSTNVLSKIVPLMPINNMVSEQGDFVIFDQDNYKKKTDDGTYEINGELFEVSPYLIKKIKENEDREMSVYLIPNNGKVLMLKKAEEATDLYPLDLNMFAIQNFNLANKDDVSREIINMSIAKQSDMNYLVEITVKDTDGDVVDMTDSDNVYPLSCATNVITSPAITGCQSVIALKYTDLTGIGSPVTGLIAANFVFRKTSDLTTVVAATITESPNGTYDVAATLAAGSTYELEVSTEKYDIANSDVVVPS